MKALKFALSAWISVMFVTFVWSALSPPSWVMFFVGMLIGYLSVPLSGWLINFVKDNVLR